jgi:hypothetical protein
LQSIVSSDLSGEVAAWVMIKGYTTQSPINCKHATYRQGLAYQDILPSWLRNTILAGSMMGKGKRSLEGQYIPLSYAQLKIKAWRSLW